MELKKVILSTLIVATANTSFAACNFSKDIVKTQDGRYSYSPDCHVQVGKDEQELGDRRKQVDLLQAAKDSTTTAYQDEKTRSENLLQTTLSLQTTLEREKKTSDVEKWLFFAGGLLVMYGASRAVAH